MQEKKYRCHLELPSATFIELVNDDQSILKEVVQNVLKGSVRFEAAGTANEPSTLIYHPSFEGGKKIIGWIAPGVVTPMTNEAFLESRHLAKQAA
jgi:hypothetical protein